MDSQELQTLNDWAARLSDDLGINNDAFRSALDLDEILSLAGAAARSVLRPAAPVTTFLVGYAAGVAAAAGTSPRAAMGSAIATALTSSASVADAGAQE